MSETATSTINLNYDPALSNREEAMRQLLPYDYDYAKEAGLVDMFYYDPETGEDGLFHTLAGNVVHTEGSDKSNDDFFVEGFHHGPSGELMWPSTINKSTGEVHPVTRVDRQHLDTLSSKKREAYRKYPLEPYRGKVAVNGLVKYAERINAEGQPEVAPAKNSMFPDEYDALAVMQAIRQAKNDPQRTEEQGLDDRGRPVVVVQGNAVLMDGQSSMPLRLTLDPKTHTVKTAMPLIKQRPGFMKLTEEQADQAMTYGLSRK